MKPKQKRLKLQVRAMPAMLFIVLPFGDGNGDARVYSLDKNSLPVLNPTPNLEIIDAGTSDNGNRGPQFIQNILRTRTSHSVAAGFGFSDGNIVRKHAYVPLTTVPIPLSSTTTLNDPEASASTVAFRKERSSIPVVR